MIWKRRNGTSYVSEIDSLSVLIYYSRRKGNEQWVLLLRDQGSDNYFYIGSLVAKGSKEAKSAAETKLKRYQNV